MATVNDVATVAAWLQREFPTAPADNADGQATLDSIRRGFAAAAGSAARTDALLLRIVEWLASGVPEKPARELLHILQINMRSVSADALRSASDLVVDAVGRRERVGDVKWLYGLMVPLFEALSKLCADPNDAFKLASVRTILALQWHPNVTVHLAAVFAEMALPEDITATAIRKLASQLPRMELNTVPPCVHQLLLLARKGLKQLVLMSIADSLERISDSGQHSGSQVALMEGTVLLHIMFAVKQDQSLGTEFVKAVKAAGHSSLRPVIVSILLAMSQIFRFETVAIDTVKSIVLNKLKFNEKLASSPWMSNYLEEEHADRTPVQVINIVLEKSVYGWDHVTHGLLRFSQVAMETQMSTFGRSRDCVRECDNGSTLATDWLVKLGVHVMATLYKTQEYCRGEIIEQVMMHMMTDSDTALNHVHVLRQISKCDSLEAQHINKLKEAISYVCQLPRHLAKQMMQSLMPLTKRNIALRDAAIVALKKGLFFREVSGRLVASDGLLELFSIMLLTYDGAAHEMVTWLGRCLSLQYEVKSSTYEGLLRIMETHNQAATLLYPLLLQQFRQYFTSDGKIELDKCQDSKNIRVEPLALLLKAFLTAHSKIMSKVDHDVQVSIRKLLSWLLEMQLQEVGLDQFDPEAETVDPKSLNTAHQLYLIYVVAIEYKLMCADSMAGTDNAVNTIRTCIGLQEKQCSLNKFLAVKSHEKATPMPNIISIGSLCRLLKTFTGNEFSSAERAVYDIVTGHHQFMESVLIWLARFLDSVTLNDVEVPEADCEHIQTVTLTTINEISRWAFDGSTSADERAQARLICTLKVLIKCFEAISKMSIARQLAIWRCNLGTDDSGSAIESLADRLKPIVNALLHDSSSIALARLGGQLLATESASLNRHLVAGTKSSLYDWSCEALKKFSLNDATTVRALLAFTLGLEHKTGQFNLARALAGDLLHTVGPFELEAEGDEGDLCHDPAVFSFLSFNMCCTATAREIFSMADTVIDDMEWVIQQLRVIEVGDSRRPKLEEEVISQLLAVVIILSLVQQTPLPALFDTEFRVLIKLFRCQTLLAKCKLADKTALANGLNESFVNLVMNLSTQLTPVVYKLIAYAQNAERQNAAAMGATTAARKAKKQKLGSSTIQQSKHLKTIPTLVYEIEQYEKCLIQLAKRSKVNLMKYCKRSTARDFRLQLDDVPDLAAEEEQGSPEK